MNKNQIATVLLHDICDYCAISLDEEKWEASIGFIRVAIEEAKQAWLHDEREWEDDTLPAQANDMEGICPICGYSHFKGVSEIEEARAQRDWLIKECERIGVIVEVVIGAPITQAYRLRTTQASESFDAHVAKMDKEHPDWRKGNNHGATSLMTVAREFWVAGARSREDHGGYGLYD